MTWIDYKRLKQDVSMRNVLERYGILETLKDRGGGKFVGPCPIHGGDNPTAFSVNTERNAWKCFSGECGGGNQIDLVARLQELSFRDAAVKLAADHNLTFSRGSGAEQPTPRQRATRHTTATGGLSSRQVVSLINPPLNRSLVGRMERSLDPTHEYLATRGITEDTAKEFGVGYCASGMHKGRMAFPIRNVDGEVVGYGGRAVLEELAREEGKYRFPSNEQGFYKSHLVYNLDRAAEHVTAGHPLIIVEGFVSVWWLAQCLGINCAVALMGSGFLQRARTADPSVRR